MSPCVCVAVRSVTTERVSSVRGVPDGYMYRSENTQRQQEFSPGDSLYVPGRRSIMTLRVFTPMSTCTLPVRSPCVPVYEPIPAQRISSSWSEPRTTRVGLAFNHPAPLLSTGGRARGCGRAAHPRVLSRDAPGQEPSVGGTHGLQPAVPSTEGGNCPPRQVGGIALPYYHPGDKVSPPLR